MSNPLSRTLSRRSFLFRSLTTSTTFYLAPGLLSSARAMPLAPSTDTIKPLSPPPDLNLGFFTAAERTVLGKLCDQVFPDATNIGAVNYIENLLTAFESDPPRIYAVNPNFRQKSGDEAEFIPLTRTQEAAWRLRLYGSQYFRGGWWNEKILGPSRGLRDMYKEELGKVTFDETGEPVYSALSKEFRLALRDAVIEGCFSAPEYGGNYQKRGWELAFYPGSSQPKGYTYDEVALPDAKDPLPMKLTSKLFLFFVSIFEHGRVYR